MDEQENGDVYFRLMNHEMLYLETVEKWEFMNKISEIFLFSSIFAAMAIMFRLNPEEAFSLLTTESKIFVASIIALSFFFIASIYTERKVSEIKASLGLTNDEKIYLEIFTLRDNIESCLKEGNKDRQKHYKEKARESLKKMMTLVNNWNYGNMKYTKELIGSQIDLFRNNVSRLMLPNIMIGNVDDLSIIINVLDRFRDYILSPTVEELNVLNDMMDGLEYREYETITKRKQIKQYFVRNKLLSRILFTLFCVMIVGFVAQLMRLDRSIIFAVLIPTFWGAFNGFDRLFASEK